MKEAERDRPTDPEPKASPSHSEEIRRVIEEYANGLREIIKKLRGRLN